MNKYIKLKNVISLQNLFNEYIQEFISRQDKDKIIEFKFDFSDLTEVEQLGYSCYLNKMETRLLYEWKGLAKYLKSINQTIDKVTIYRYEFRTKQEYKKCKIKENLKISLTLIAIIGFMIVYGFLVIK